MKNGSMGLTFCTIGWNCCIGFGIRILCLRG